MNRNLNVLIALIAGLSVILGFWGYYELIPGSYSVSHRLTETVYQTMRLFAMDFFDPAMQQAWGLPEVWEPSLKLQVARFLAPLVTIVTLLGAFSLIVQNLFRRMRIALFYRNHSVVLGKGQLTEVLVRDLLERKKRVILVAGDPLASYPKDILRQPRLIPIQGSTLHSSVLEKAKINRAKEVFFLNEKDEENVLSSILVFQMGVAAVRRGESVKTAGYMQLARPSLIQQIKADRKLEALGDFFHLEIFDPYDRLARSLVRQVLTDLRRRAGGEPTPQRLLLIGLGKLGSRVLEQILRQWYLPDLPALEIQVVEPNRDQIQSMLNDFPILRYLDGETGAPMEGQVRILFRDMHFPKVEFRCQSAEVFYNDYLRLEPDAADYDCAIISLGEIIENYSLASFLHHSETPVFNRIYFRLHRKASEVGNFLDELILQQDPLREARDSAMIPFGMAEEQGRWDALVQPEIDLMARTLHETYLSNLDGVTDTPALRPWEHLGEPFRDTNRAAADHLWFKLAWLGVELSSKSNMDLAGLANHVEEKLKAQIENETLIPLAKSEHDRWMADKLLDGWLPGPQRDNKRKLHDKLVPWNWDGPVPLVFEGFKALDTVDIDKDIRVLLEIPNYLRAVGQKG